MSVDASVPQQSVPHHAVVGVVPPSVREAKIRTIWPSVTASSKAIASIGKMLIGTKFLAPAGWLLMAPLYFKKILPIVGRKYTLTNRRVVVQKGWKSTDGDQIELKDIDEIRLDVDSYDDFFRSGTLEFYSGGSLKLKLEGVPEPQTFRQAILSAMMASVPEKAKALPMLPASGA